jgi:hypothetical protein
MTKVSQRTQKTRHQTYEEKLAELHESVIKPILANAGPKPKADYIGIFFGIPMFFLAFPLLFGAYFCLCAIIMGLLNTLHFVIQTLFALL